MSRRRVRRLWPLILLLFIPIGHLRLAEAHDFWIAPTPLAPRAGQPVLLRFMVGERFEGDEVPYESRRMARFQHLAAKMDEPVTGREGYSPAAVLAALTPGVHVLAYTSVGTDIHLEADRFNHHLEQEGLRTILAARRGRSGQDRVPVQERFFRYAKALLVTLDAKPQGTVASRVLGQRLELVPEFDPTQVAVKRQTVRVRVLFEGKPLTDATIVAVPEADPEGGQLQEITDGDGRAAFALDRSGAWMLKVVWMVPGSGTVDWESFWGSLVFRAG